MSGIDPREIFLQEAQDLLAQLEATLLDLEHTPADGEQRRVYPCQILAQPPTGGEAGACL